jgi:hypothetical protein
MNAYTKTESEMLNYLYSVSLPSTITAPEVEWIYINFHGLSVGITNEQAQALKIISERGGENFCGGVLEYVRGRNFAGAYRLEV